MYKEQIAALKQKATAAAKRGADINAGVQARGATATATEDETKAFDAALAEYDQVQAEIRRLERLESAQAEEARQAESRTQPIRQEGDENRGRSPAQVHNNAEDKPWESFGHWLQQIRVASMSQNIAAGAIDPRLMKEVRGFSTRAASGLSEAIPADGGFAVTKDVAAEIFRNMHDSGQILSRCRTVPISTNSNGIKINAIDEQSRATGSRWGGVQAYWANESDSVTASKPKFRQMELSLNKLFATYYATDEVVQDAAALGAIAQEAFTEELRFVTENAVIRGTGAGQPKGILNATALVSVAKESAQTATTFNYANFVKMWQRLWARSRSNAVILINQDVEQQLYQMTISGASSGVFPVYLPPGMTAANAPYGTLFGRPVIPVEYCATLGTVGDVIIADFSQYLLIEKGGIQSAESMHVRFLNDEMCYRLTYRVDGQPMWNTALTPFQGSNTLSPFIVVATRS